MSQADLARCLGMRPGPVNNIENGRNLPSAKVLCKLATVLDVPIDALFGAAPQDGASCVREERATYVTGSDRFLNGPHADLCRTAVERSELAPAVLSDLSGLVDAVLALEDICGVQKMANLPLQLPFTFSEEGLLSLCAQIRRLLGISEAVIFDYLELFENAGLRVVFCELPADVESLSCYDAENGNAFIFVSQGMNPERQLFRTLYELGRIYAYTQQRPGETGVTAGRDYRGKPLTPDRLARRFAGLFLMPETAVRATVGQLAITKSGWTYDLLLRIKHRFGVSAEAFLYRLDELGLVQRKLVAAFRLRIRAHYMETQNAEPDSTRRILTPNGRLGDLLALAERAVGNEELDQIGTTLIRCGVRTGDDASSTQREAVEQLRQAMARRSGVPPDACSHSDSTTALHNDRNHHNGENKP